MKEYKKLSFDMKDSFLSVHLFGRVYFPFLFQKVTTWHLTAAAEDLDLPGGGIFGIGKATQPASYSCGTVQLWEVTQSMRRHSVRLGQVGQSVR